MNRDILAQAGVDYDFGVKRFVGRAQLFEKALTRFYRDDTFSRVSAAYEARDREGLLAAAHEFKGMCGNIGLTVLFEAADAIVQLLRQGDCEPERLQEAYRLLESRYRAVLAAVGQCLEADR